jgi:hypothetical protein
MNDVGKYLKAMVTPDGGERINIFENRPLFLAQPSTAADGEHRKSSSFSGYPTLKGALRTRKNWQEHPG